MAVRLGTGGARNLFCNVSGPIHRVSPLDNELCSMTNHREKAKGEVGDCWTWTALDADTKLMPIAFN
jgi:hypothetical protein